MVSENGGSATCARVRVPGLTILYGMLGSRWEGVHKGSVKHTAGGAVGSKDSSPDAVEWEPLRIRLATYPRSLLGLVFWVVGLSSALSHRMSSALRKVR